MLFEKANNQVAFAFRENRMHNIAQANFFLCDRELRIYV